MFFNCPPISSQEEVATCEIKNLENVNGMSYLDIYAQFYFSENFEIYANAPVKLSLSSVNVVTEPEEITRNTRVIVNLRHLDQDISHMVDWVTKDAGSVATDAQNSLNNDSRYRVWGYVRNLTAPGEYSYSLTINCLL